MFYSLKSGVKLNYILCGNGNGKPLLFLHDYAEAYESLKDYNLIILDSHDFQHDTFNEDIDELIIGLNLENPYVIGEKSEMLSLINSFDKKGINFILINENEPIDELLELKWENTKENFLNVFEVNLNSLINLDKYVLMNILYEDNHVLVVNKPCGLLSQKERGDEIDILDVYKIYLKDKYSKPGNVYLGLVQRLDRNVSGIMVLSKTSKAHERLNKDRPEKKYIALVSGMFKDDSGTLINYIDKDEKKRMAFESKSGKKAILKYTVLEKRTDLTLLDIFIETGRFHQIRFQLSNLGFPIVNDYKYGYNKRIISNEIGLECYFCKFKHPTKDEMMEFKIDSRVRRLYEKENY